MEILDRHLYNIMNLSHIINQTEVVCFADRFYLDENKKKLTGLFHFEHF